MFKKTEEVLAILRSDILSGKRTGEMPSERMLCQTYGIGRGAAVSIVHALEAEQLITRQSPRKYGIIANANNQTVHKKILVIGHPFYIYGWGGMQSDLLMQGVCEEASKSGLECEILVRDQSDIDNSHLQALYNHQYIGVIFLELYSEATAKELFEKNIPVVIANCETASKLPSTRMDYRGIGRLAGYELIHAGHKRIGTLTGNLNHFIFSEMLAGLRGALAEEQVSFDTQFVFPMDSLNFQVLKNCGYLINMLNNPDRPTAFFVMRSLRLRPLFELCYRLGIAIPQDLNVISFDDVSLPSSFSKQYGVIADRPYELGQHSVRMLLSWFENDTVPESIILPSQILRSMPVS